MNNHPARWIVTVLLTASVASGVGCYPASYYTARRAPVSSGYEDSKGYSVPAEPAPRPQGRYVGVNPGLVVAGAVAAGALGYALGNNHSHNVYYGPRYYAPAPYARPYYGRYYCR